MRATPSEIKFYFTYDEVAGLVRWRVYHHKGKTGAEAGTGRRRYISLNGYKYPESHIVWVLVYGEWPDSFLDHIDRDNTNNRVTNLRKANRGQNAINAGLRSDNTSGFRGVSFYKRTRKYRSYVCRNGITKFYGMFDTAEEAAEVSRLKRIELFGKFAEEGNEDATITTNEA